MLRIFVQFNSLRFSINLKFLKCGFHASLLVFAHAMGIEFSSVLFHGFDTTKSLRVLSS